MIGSAAAANRSPQRGVSFAKFYTMIDLMAFKSDKSFLFLTFISTPISSGIIPLSIITGFWKQFIFFFFLASFLPIPLPFLQELGPNAVKR